ncbi:MAG: L28 family ribosomal protein [Patescibacteria group bacterium]|nr:L28 family ribosomal protein [Patescibacteria group bacterium]MDD5121062.1 L28 family ribosomal protein [Patescibacteria group bacterium]MDD5221576.1 L28 family ribosomal protein [Patescibacteria group bacterium]MDD5396019.1 L28 family ribosomal protein [Patescibacteria group bacterium]
MSKTCPICGRGPKASFSRSHSMIASKRRQLLNLQTATINGKKITACNSCLKTLKKKNKK